MQLESFLESYYPAAKILFGGEIHRAESDHPLETASSDWTTSNASKNGT